jgi:hypothetical protein
MDKQAIVDKYGLKNWRHAVVLAVTMVLIVISLIFTIYELTTATGNDFKFVRICVSLSFFAAAMIFTLMGYNHAGLTHARILILFRIIGVVLNIIACFIYSVDAIQWWVYAYLFIILIGLIAFLAALDKPQIASPIIITLIIVALVYSIARVVLIGQTILEAFRPVLFEWIIATIYWSKRAREEVSNSKK